MKKLNKKGFTLVELLAVIVILAILMAIAATNIGPVIDNTRRSSMRTTAQNIMEAVRIQLTSNYALYEGKYRFTNTILESGGVSAPFGGEYAFSAGDDSKRVANTGIYTDGNKTTSTQAECNNSAYSYVTIKRTEETYIWAICLTTKDKGATGATKGNQPGGYLYATRQQLDDKDDTSIFYGKAKLAG